MTWLAVAVGFAALFVTLVVWSALVAGRREDAQHGRLEEQR